MHQVDRHTGREVLVVVEDRASLVQAGTGYRQIFWRISLLRWSNLGMTLGKRLCEVWVEMLVECFLNKMNTFQDNVGKTSGPGIS